MPKRTPENPGLVQESRRMQRLRADPVLKPYLEEIERRYADLTERLRRVRPADRLTGEKELNEAFDARMGAILHMEHYQRQRGPEQKAATLAAIARAAGAERWERLSKDIDPNAAKAPSNLPTGTADEQVSVTAAEVTAQDERAEEREKLVHLISKFSIPESVKTSGPRPRDTEPVKFDRPAPKTPVEEELPEEARIRALRGEIKDLNKRVQQSRTDVFKTDLEPDVIARENEIGDLERAVTKKGTTEERARLAQLRDEIADLNRRVQQSRTGVFKTDLEPEVLARETEIKAIEQKIRDRADPTFANDRNVQEAVLDSVQEPLGPAAVGDKELDDSALDRLEETIEEIEEIEEGASVETEPVPPGSAAEKLLAKPELAVKPRAELPHVDERIERIKKEAEEACATRSAELDTQAKGLGPVAERIVRGITNVGEWYNKKSWKYKIAAGVALGAGAAAFAGVSPVVVGIFGGALAAQRLAGFAGAYVKREKHLLATKEGTAAVSWLTPLAGKDWYKKIANLPDKERRLFVASYAAAYTVGMGLAVGEAVHVASESALGEAVQGFLRSHWPFAVPEAKVTGPREPAVTTPQAHGGYIEPLPGEKPPEGPVSAPLPPVPPHEPAPPAPPESHPQAPAPKTFTTSIPPETHPAPPPGRMALPPDVHPPPIPAHPEAAAVPVLPEPPPLVVEVRPGYGAEAMMKDLWRQMHDASKDFKLPTGIDPNGESEMAQLFRADEKSIDGLVHRLALKHEGMFEDGKDVVVGKGSTMTFEQGAFKLTNTLDTRAPAPAVETPPPAPAAPVALPEIERETLAPPQDKVVPEPAPVGRAILPNEQTPEAFGARRGGSVEAALQGSSAVAAPMAAFLAPKAARAVRAGRIVEQPTTHPVPPIAVEAATGKGYDEMIRQIWTDIQGKGLNSNMYPVGSDIHRLLIADERSIGRIAHLIAVDQKHQFFGAPPAGLVLELGSDGNLHVLGEAGATAAVPAVAAHTVAAAGPRPTAREAARPPEPAPPARKAENVFERTGSFRNSHGLEIDPRQGAVYELENHSYVAYCNDYALRRAAAEAVANENRGVQVWFEAEHPIEDPPGSAQLVQYSVSVIRKGLFSRATLELPPGGRPPKGQTGPVNPDLFIARVYPA